jgi:hypothetical protein
VLKKQNIVIAISIFAICLSTISLVRSSPIETTPAEESPHAQALALVFQLQQAKIREIEREDWWLDTKVRQWEVKRPFAPGQIDTTHTFIVTYKIDGKQVFWWAVDTRSKTVSVSNNGASQ